MRRRKRGDRLYLRGSRYYGDFRDLGGKQEALIPVNGTRATTDRDEAMALAAKRLEALKELRRLGHSPGDADEPTLADYARYHLQAKAHSRRSSTVERDERSLSKVLEFFADHLKMPSVRLSQITVERLTQYLGWRRVQPGRNGRTIAAQTQLHELHALSNLFKRAVAEARAVENPTQRLIDKPKIEREEAVYLEPGEVARLLAAARKLDAKGQHVAIPYLLPLIATHVYTGGRPDEVRGLEIQDIDFRHGVLWFRPNEWRRLKRPWSKRSVPLWPDLRNTLRVYIGDRRRGLLFPARNGKMTCDFRNRLEAAVKEAKIDKRVTPKTFRHTYTAMRLQTTDNGKPVSVWQVACELGHRDTNLIERTYGHLLNTRDRSSVVEYREAEVMPFRERAAR